MEAGDKQQMAVILRQYKLPNGAVNYPTLFTIPSQERITVLAQQNFARVNMLIIAALTMAFESMNLKKGMNEIQILDLSESIVDTAAEDNLSIEDVVLFLQNLVRGKYEVSYENMDIPKFMRIFEIYRQERHDAIRELNENRHLQFKALGDATRTSKNDPLAEHFSSMGERISELKESLQYEKNRHLRDIDNF